MTNMKQNNTKSASAAYQSYLLRIWRETPEKSPRIYLQDAASGEKRAFPNLESLYAFLAENEDYDIDLFSEDKGLL